MISVFSGPENKIQIFDLTFKGRPFKQFSFAFGYFLPYTGQAIPKHRNPYITISLLIIGLLS